MIKLFTRLTILSIILFFGSFAQSEVDAAAGMSGENYYQNKVQYSNHFNFGTYFKDCKIVWKNGKFTVVKKPEQEQEQGPIDVTPVTPDVNEEQQEETVDTPESEEIVNTPEVEQNNNEVHKENDSLNQFEREMFELTNNERVKNGLSPFQIDYELSRVAREKSRDMAVNGYFDHNSPTYGSPFDMMRSYGISYRAAGENIAKGQRSPAEVVNAWMNSPGHRANILNADFTHIGVGYIEQGNVWTQQFIGK